MKKEIITISFSFLLTLMFACLFGAHSILLAAESSNLGDKHKNAGVGCESCHKENPPSKLVPMQICLECHGGDYGKLAEQATKVTPNPHDSHLGKAQCEFCHHAHKSSEYYCAKCHILDSKVP